MPVQVEVILINMDFHFAEAECLTSLEQDTGQYNDAKKYFGPAEHACL